MARPMFHKYQEVWAAHAATYGPKTALLYQVGGFFEIYDTENLVTGKSRCNIREIAELCQFSLSVHVLEGGVEQTLFGGCPEPALLKYERTLVQAGYTVVVVVQKKSASGSVEDRVVDHISSPGCFVEGAQERRLVGLLLETVGRDRLLWAAVAIDLATGRIWFTEGSAVDRLHQFLCMHPPSEIIVWTDGIANAASTSIMDGLASSSPKIRCVPPASVAVEESILLRFWSPLSRLDWLPRQPFSRQLLAAVMQFTADHMPSALASLALPIPWIPAGEVRLGNTALEQLGLVSMTGAPSLLSILDTCRSVQGRRLFRSRLLQPISEVAVLEKRLDRVELLQSKMKDDAVTDRHLRSLYDMTRIGRRIELGSSTISDISCLLRSYESAAALMAAHPDSETGSLIPFLQESLAPWNLEAVSELARQGVTVPVADYPFHASNTTFDEGAAIRSEVTALCNSWITLSGIKGKDILYLEDAEGGGFRIVGTKKRISAVYSALRDGGDGTATVVAYKASMSLSNAALDALSGRGRTWWSRWSSMWPGVWSAATRPLLLSLTAVADWLAELDVAWSLARTAQEWSWVRPQFLEVTDSSSLEIEGLRHPILERLIKVPYVAHSISLKDGSDAMTGMLLYGMNASGKSSLMKAVGLCSILAQTGCPVPASHCKIRPFTAIFTRILGNDNLWAGLSSFAVEMTEFREILRHADKGSLVLGDELCSGTESLSATALVAAGVESLAARKSKFIFATHLHELAALPDVASIPTVKAFHLKVTYNAATDILLYDRTLSAGSGSALYGLEVCKALDLPSAYLDRAVAIRQGLAGFQAARPSSYSSAAVVSSCEVCGSSTSLEMHHIRSQKSGGPAMHTPGNLVCLCGTCHDRHHSGALLIEGWLDTSAGRELLWKPGVIEKVDEEDPVTGWIRDQKRQKIRVATIQRVATQIFGVTLSVEQIRSA
jgi:DNA mismatch repair protein MutS